MLNVVEKLVQELIRAVKAERRAEIEAMRREMRILSAEERERRGRAINGVRGKKIGEIFDQIIVRFGRKQEIKTDIKPGDVVVVSRGDPLRSDLVGTVIRVGRRFIDVSLPVLPAWAKRRARIDLYADDTTFKRWIEILEKLPGKSRQALELALGKRRPNPVKEVEFVPEDKRLDESKRRAISRALGARDFFLIHGPFGTGKTTALTELILQLVKRGQRVLATAETNVAVDNLVERLYGRANVVRVGNPARVNRALLETTLQARMEAHPKYKELLETKELINKLREEQERFVKPVPKFRRGLSDEQILSFAERGKGTRGINRETIMGMAEWLKRQKKIEELVERAKSLEASIVKDILESADVVLTTNSSAALDILPDSFDVAVIDEATQATVPSVLIPISRAKRFILAGDHRQLPPTVISPRARILSRTLFEMLIEKHPDHSEMLEIQYRMNERLAEFPSKEFYNGRVKTAEVVKNITLADLGIPEKTVLEFVDTKKVPAKWDRRERGGASFFNPLEVRIVVDTVSKLLSMGAKPEWIGVITPYDAQKELLRQELPEDVEVNTVDGYQGREKEIIVISLVRSNTAKNIGFLTDLRRLNVALTRAKRKLILVGDSETLENHETYRRLIDHIKKHGRYVELPPDVAE